MVAEILTPGLILFGEGSLARSAEVLGKIGISRPLIITDRGLAKAPIFEAFKAILISSGVEFGVFSETVPDPDMDAVEAGVNAFRAGNYDGLVGFGGGSAMDTAKAMNVWLHSDGDIRKWRVPAAPSMPVLPLICVPTTAGTGSEVTRATVITDPVTHEKILFMGLACVPTAAIVDPDLTRELPFRIAADTGIDALTHAIEAYVSRRRNPHSDAMALNAMRLIGPNLIEACIERSNEARSAVMLGATHAGIAFSNASVALVHGMSRPLGSFFKMPHGMSNAVLLPSVTVFSAPAALDRYAICSRTIGFADASDDDEAAKDKLLHGLEGLNRELKVPTLSEFGISREDYFEKIPIMAEQAVASGSPNNNPRIANVAEISELYADLWS